MFTTSGQVQLYTVRQCTPHECTMHGDNRHPDLDLEYGILDPDRFTYSNLPNFEELFRFFEGTGSLQYPGIVNCIVGDNHIQ
jgi:hypothetical protein